MATPAPATADTDDAHTNTYPNASSRSLTPVDEAAGRSHPDPEKDTDAKDAGAPSGGSTQGTFGGLTFPGGYLASRTIASSRRQTTLQPLGSFVRPYLIASPPPPYRRTHRRSPSFNATTWPWLSLPFLQLSLAIPSSSPSHLRWRPQSMGYRRWGVAGPILYVR